MKRHFLICATLGVLAASTLPGSATGWAPPGYGAPGYAPPSMPASIHIRRHLDQSNYYITVLLEGVAPQDILVSVEQGRWLMLRGDTGQSNDKQTRSEDGSRYSRSYSFSSSRLSRRIHLPRDADHAALKRENREGELEITIPRRR